MSKSIGILDKDYLQWVKELSIRYRQSQIKAAVKVNGVLIEFYWGLGSDIVSLAVDNKYGGKFYATLSADLRKEMPGIEGLSETNIRYAKRFYQLYAESSRRNGIISRFDLSHHRAYHSVHGGSLDMLDSSRNIRAWEQNPCSASICQ